MAIYARLWSSLTIWFYGRPKILSLKRYQSRVSINVEQPHIRRSLSSRWLDVYPRGRADPSSGLDVNQYRDFPRSPRNKVSKTVLAHVPKYLVALTYKPLTGYDLRKRPEMLGINSRHRRMLLQMPKRGSAYPEQASRLGLLRARDGTEPACGRLAARAEIRLPALLAIAGD